MTCRTLLLAYNADDDAEMTRRLPHFLFQEQRSEAAAEINAIYAARRAKGLSDNDAGMGRVYGVADTGADWRK